ncbi:acyl-CoA dehydrogenase family protein [Oricola sp.]|uniref:acyl-CoA dehydrogenase family protein n=1 Tax=Oricola sp. TaxID=1979950 RepID=UPI0025EDA3F6|nr:acyl-CoA dehydrogenase family protein [Oricola sp.]MCI5075354.1 acyl-CoA dehydrogenase family protein [Oricola sp.]
MNFVTNTLAPYPAPYPEVQGRPTLLEEAKKLEQMLLDAEDIIENERRVPDEITDALYDNGIYRAFLPRELGGLEVHPLEWLDAVEELSRVNGSVGWLCMLHSGQTFLKREVMEKLLTEDRWIMASNVGRAAGKAVRVPGGYRISGRWSFTSGSPEANWLSGRCILYDENDQPVMNPRDGLPWFIVGLWPAKDATLIDTWDGHGLRGTGSGDFEIKDLFVPREMVNEAGIWKRPYDRALYRYWFNVMAHGAHALGLARAAIEEFTGLVHVAARHGSYRQAKLGKEQVNQIALGKADTQVRAARAYFWQLVGEAYDDAVESWPVNYDLRVRLQAALLHTVHTSRQVIDTLFQQAGAPAVFRGRRLERIHRDILTAANHALMAEAALDRVGQYLMSKDLPSGPEIEIGGIGFIPGPHPQHDRIKPWQDWVRESETKRPEETSVEAAE